MTAAITTTPPTPDIVLLIGIAIVTVIVTMVLVIVLVVVIVIAIVIVIVVVIVVIVVALSKWLLLDMVIVTIGWLLFVDSFVVVDCFVVRSWLALTVS